MPPPPEAACFIGIILACAVVARPSPRKTGEHPQGTSAQGESSMTLRNVTRNLAVGIAAGIALIATQSAWAADDRGSVQGVVNDASGKPVTGALVKLKNAERRLTFMVPSQDQGRFEAKDLPVGKYTVQGVGGGFQSGVSAPVSVTANQAPKPTSRSPPRAGRCCRRPGRSAFRRRSPTRPPRTSTTCRRATTRCWSRRAARRATTCSGSWSSAPTRTTGTTSWPACGPAWRRRTSRSSATRIPRRSWLICPPTSSRCSPTIPTAACRPNC